ncbi:hypothetical protein [Chryseobacterium viscerum]|uniref:hypothetical protein n=1 Tax=Chryseobacterium viscerum TaxID=1037377 RepID=UPI002221A182|nr:hypothetical protein [Chryseobacterium viscerum]MCW1962897.1 hypothetical protein [Chryseobacterium viscerum]
MQEYNITIFRQSRILLCLFLLPVIFLTAIFIGAETNSFVISVLFIIISLLLIYYYIIGRLKITVNENELFFEWRKKIIFNYNPIKSIKINDIKTIVLDEERLLRKIKTHDAVIYINNSKIKSEDVEKFINRLKNDIKKNDIKVIDSWDEFAEKGHLRLAYRINSIVLIISIIIIIIFTVLKGFNPVSLSILLLFIPQMILYQKQMKGKN